MVMCPIIWINFRMILGELAAISETESKAIAKLRSLTIEKLIAEKKANAGPATLNCLYATRVLA